MIINKWIKIKGNKYPYIETPVSKQELSELQDDYRKFYLHDHKQNKVYPVLSNRVTHSYKIELGERGMYYIGGSILGLFVLSYIKRQISKKVNKFNPFYTSPEMEEFLRNVENKTPKEEDLNSVVD